MPKLSGPVRVGLAAYGMSGAVFHAPLINDVDGFQLIGAVERPTTRQRKYNLLTNWPEATRFTSYEELLASEVDLVVVNTPQHLHYEQGLQALRAGKHILLEKPATLKASELAHLYELAASSGLSVVIFQNRRWDADYLTLSQIIRSGALGRVVQYDATYNRWRNYIECNTWKEEPSVGSGLLYNLGPHLIDQVLFLFGKPASVFGLLKAERTGGKVVDAFHIILNYANGLTASLRSSYLVKEPVPRYAIHGDKGSFVKYGLDIQEDDLKAGLVPSTKATWGQEPEENWGTLATESSGQDARMIVPSLPGAYQKFYRGLYDHLTNDAPPPVDFETPLVTMQVIEAVMESSATGRLIRL